MLDIFPNVQKGDRLQAVYGPTTGTEFFLNDKVIGRIKRPFVCATVFWNLVARINDGACSATSLVEEPMSAPPLINAQAKHGLWLVGFALGFCGLAHVREFAALYATQFAVPLTSLGAVLLFSRLIDALVDPMLGRLSDALYLRSSMSVLGVALAYAIGLLLSFALLFSRPLSQTLLTM